MHEPTEQFQTYLILFAIAEKYYWTGCPQKVDLSQPMAIDFVVIGRLKEIYATVMLQNSNPASTPAPHIHSR